MLGYSFRLWLGSAIFAFGVLWWTWFLRNLFRKRINKARLYTEFHPVIQILWNTFWIALGLWIYPIEQTTPLIPLIIGILLGLYFSR
jgi:hypothetical protein